MPDDQQPHSPADDPHGSHAYAVLRAADEQPHGTPPGVPATDLVAADPIRRLGAYAFDLGLVVLAFVGGALLARWLEEHTNEPTAVIVAPWAVVLLALVTEWTMVAFRGQSLGKLLCRVKIVALDGRPCGFMRGVVVRSVLPWAILAVTYWRAASWGLPSTAVNVAVIGTLFADKLMVFSADSRRLIDHLAGTRVVAVDPLPPLPERE